MPQTSTNSPDNSDLGDLSFLDEASVPPLNLSQESESFVFRRLPIEALEPNPWNPNHMNDREFQLLVETLSNVGVISPIQCVEMSPGRYRILGGEHRWRACKALRHQEIPALILTDPRVQAEDFQKFITMQLNNLHGKDDPEKFIALYAGLRKRFSDQQLRRQFGVSNPSKWTMLVSSYQEGLPSELRAEFAKKAKAAKGDPKKLEDITKDLLTRYADGDKRDFLVMTTPDGGKPIWVRMGPDLDEAMRKLLACCRDRAMDINPILAEAVVDAVKKLATSTIVDTD